MLHDPNVAPAPIAVERATRQEVQALRALAVALVVVYHVWPARLPGGFVGVDVFFVISGFLITSHLLREVARTGTVNVTRFWARRVRRLLPAAFVVLAACFVLVVLCVPKAEWPRSFVEIAASGLYVENWVLAANSVDYLAVANQATLAQHFWSLSVEEQFYIVWPWLIVATLAVARRFAPRVGGSRAIGGALALVAVGSLVFSITETARSQASAYFVTPTRAWEFAAGGLLALAPAAVTGTVWSAVWLRTLAGWMGLGAIVASALLLSSASAFPGWIALVPVLGTVLVIWAGDVRSRLAATGYTAVRPVQFIGDISYSVYLWHWPLVALYPLFFVRSPSLLGGIAIIGATIVLAWLSKRFVEDPVRTGQFWTGSRRRVFGFAAAGMAATLAATVIGGVVVRDLGARASGSLEPFTSQSQVTDAIAATLALHEWPMADQVAGNDAQAPEWIVDRCTSVFERDLDRCSYGDPSAAHLAVVVGDSYATTYLPAIRGALENDGWRIQVLTLEQCPIAEVPVHQWGTSREFVRCAEHREWVHRTLGSLSPDLVIAASSTKSTLARLTSGASGEAARAEWAEGLDASLERLAEHGAPVAVLGGPPAANCTPGPLRPPSACSGPPRIAEQPLLDAEERAVDAAGLTFIDTRWWFCLERSTTCPEQVGPTLVRADHDHLTGTYSARLGPVLRAALERRLPALADGRATAGGAPAP
jgi:peptidoglycan/LPS O-acetylase OafA/YrhL